MSLSYVNNASAYAIGLRLLMLQIYLHQYWTVAEMHKEMEIGSSIMYNSVQYMSRPYYY